MGAYVITGRIEAILAMSCFMLCSIAGDASAAPAHYIVFERSGSGTAEPVLHARVDLSGDHGSPGNGARKSSRQTEDIRYRPVKNGQPGDERRIEIPRLMRAEFAHDTETGMGEIDAHAPVVVDRSAFVLRIPAGEADSIELLTENGAQRVDLDQIEAQAEQLPLVKYASRMKSNLEMTSDQAGDPRNRLDILVLGDGYTADQQPLFQQHFDMLRSGFNEITPHKEYANFVNWTAGFLVSAQSGADHPPYQPGCASSDCCADNAAQGDPLAGTYVDTALNATFCTANIHRLLTVDMDKVFAAAAAWPDWDQILVIVNDPTYGGSGGTFSVTSAAPSAKLIAIHELGHSFQGLADEYVAPYPGFPVCSDVQYAPMACEVNVTDVIDPAQIKWSAWIEQNTLIPTPPGTPGVGLFEGARYQTFGMFRPQHQGCLMRALAQEYCPICRQEYVRTLYRGGNFAPYDGIDLIEPFTEWPRPDQAVGYATGTVRRFQADILRPTIGSVALQWYLDGEPVADAVGEHFDFTQLSLQPNLRVLELRATDETFFVHPEMSEGLLEHSRTWVVEVGNDRLFEDRFQF